MTALRCTQKLLSAAKALPAPAIAAPANVLGDWSLTLLHVRPQKLLLAVSEVTRLGLVLPAAPLASFPVRFIQVLFENLVMLGVPPDRSRAEIEAMAPLTIAATNSRSVLSHVNRYADLVEWLLSEELLLGQINLRLADDLVLKPSAIWPGEETLRLLGGDAKAFKEGANKRGQAFLDWRRNN